MSKLNNKRKIAILGDMFELGDYAKELHREVGKQVYKNNIDILMCSGENSKYIIEQAKMEGMQENNLYYMESKEDIIQKIADIVKPGDVILVKASNGMKFYELPERIMNKI